MTSKNPEGGRHWRQENADRATWALVILNAIVAIFTAALALAAFLTLLQERRASNEQLGVQTWIYLAPRFDSDELRLARKGFARQLDPYDPAKRAKMDEDVLDFFESVGALYDRNLLNKELAASSFGYWAARYWEAAKPYIDDERRAEHDESVWDEVEAFGKAMEKKKQAHVTDADLKAFLADEETLVTDQNAPLRSPAPSR
jgi:hypothetical protein